MSNTYIHPQHHLSLCSNPLMVSGVECNATPSRTKGEKEFMIFCPNEMCANVGVRARTVGEVERLWNEQNK